MAKSAQVVNRKSQNEYRKEINGSLYSDMEERNEND